MAKFVAIFFCFCFYVWLFGLKTRWLHVINVQLFILSPLNVFSLCSNIAFGAKLYYKEQLPLRTLGNEFIGSITTELLSCEKEIIQHIRAPE